MGKGSEESEGSKKVGKEARERVKVLVLVTKSRVICCNTFVVRIFILKSPFPARKWRTSCRKKLRFTAHRLEVSLPLPSVAGGRVIRHELSNSEQLAAKVFGVRAAKREF